MEWTCKILKRKIFKMLEYSYKFFKQIFYYSIILLFQFIFYSVYAQNISTSTCLNCHIKLAEKKVIHPTVKEDCLKCHEPNGKEHPQEDVEGFNLTQKVPQLCFSCHDEKKLKQEHLHSPVKEGDCFSCHEVHSSKNEHLLVVIPPALCYSCHTDLKDTIYKSSLVHSAINEKKSCINCHSPHSSGEKKILLIQQPTLCLSCHNKPIVKKEHTIPNMKQLLEKSKYIHGAIENNGCAICHNPHASNNSFLLNTTFPQGNYAEGKKENFAVCMKCHESTLIEDSISTETGFRNGEENLHFKHVNKKKGRNCINCHNVHASNNLFLIADKTNFGNWEMPIRYTRTKKGGSCFPGCHAEKKYER